MPDRHPPSWVQRIATAFRKFGFCFRITASTASFFRLLVNTKRFAWTNGHDQQMAPVPYSIKLQNAARTIYLRTHAGDLQIFYDIFLTGVYRLPASVFLQSRTIVDIGSHIGMSALFFHSQCPDAMIYSIEADPDNFALLQKNLQQSGKLIATHAAINDKTEPVYLQKESFSFNTHIAKGITGLSVPGIDIHSFLKHHQIHHIDIIKIDIEGAEQVLFNGDTGWLSITDHILIETHSPEDLSHFTRTVTAFGFTIEERKFEYETVYWARRPARDVRCVDQDNA